MAFYRGRLTKVSDNPNALRTPSIDGYFSSPPTLGQSFVMYADALDPKADFRQVATSIVKAIIESDTHTRFNTLNSVYELTDIRTIEFND